MHANRCPGKCSEHTPVTRREFISASAVTVASVLLGGCTTTTTTSSPVSAQPAPLAFHPSGPASRCRPTIKVAFVRRKGEYGMWWPGAVYDGEAARKQYTEKIRQTAQALRVNAEVRPEPIHSLAEAEMWRAEAQAARADGLFLVLLDRQQHTWPTAQKAIDSELPAVIFAPVGSSFTTNTATPSKKAGGVIYSTDDFSQAAYGMKMLQAAAKMRATRVVVIRGNDRRDAIIPQLGIQLRIVPASTFVDAYRAMPESPQMLALADQYIRAARKVFGATRQDVINGARSYMVARKIMQQEDADGISMDCLGTLGPTKMSLPCLAWSRMNDDGIPAACEADIGAVASHVLVQYLFDRPGFQVDPVAETSRKAVIGAHCSCPTRLNGFTQPPEPYVLRHHHAERDATAQTIWRVGQPVTCVDVLTEQKNQPTRILISSGHVTENVSVPPAGGCVVSVMVKLDGVDDVLAYPGFHQIFCYGNYRQQLLEFCQLYKIEPQVV